MPSSEYPHRDQLHILAETDIVLPDFDLSEIALITGAGRELGWPLRQHSHYQVDRRRYQDIEEDGARSWCDLLREAAALLRLSSV